MTHPVRVLVIAGSDSGGGAGIQADIKTISAWGGFAMTVVTAVTAQNTLGVHDVQMISTDIITAQFNAIMRDIGADAIKIGMLGDVDTVLCVSQLLKQYSDIPVILDPVMQAKGGAALLHDDAVTALKEHLLPCATIVTPNMPEAEMLCNLPIDSMAARQKACRMIAKFGDVSVILKGGHGEEEELCDLLYYNNQFYYYNTPRIDTMHTHGTGCSFASAIATLIAQGTAIEDAMLQAQSYIRQAILNAPGFGAGHGPLWHQN